MNNLELIGVGLAAFRLRAQKRKKRSMQRNCWVRKWLSRRNTLGSGNRLFWELAEEEPKDFKNWLRMDKENFDVLLGQVGHYIKKQDTRFRESISASQRLAVTLRYLATGETQTSLAYNFRIAQTTISRIIHETTTAIYLALKDKYLSPPRTSEDWEKVADGFLKYWQFPNCLGALDGKHVKIQPPRGSGSEFYNYKKFFSIVLMAAVGSEYEFLYVDIGTNGRVSDGGVWSKSTLAKAFESNKVDSPGWKRLPNSAKVCPHVLIADDAFAMKQYLMKPYPGSNLTREQRIFNYRLSRARRVVENAFGILANRWRFLLGTNLSSPERVETQVLAAICLHNYLIRDSKSRRNYITENLVDHEDENGNVIPGSWRTDYAQSTYDRPTMCDGFRSSVQAKNIQEMFKEYFNNEGKVDFQDSRA